MKRPHICASCGDCPQDQRRRVRVVRLVEDSPVSPGRNACAGPGCEHFRTDQRSSRFLSPRDSLWRLQGHHPTCDPWHTNTMAATGQGLQRPEYASKAGRLAEGYAIAPPVPQRLYILLLPGEACLQRWIAPGRWYKNARSPSLAMEQIDRIRHNCRYLSAVEQRRAVSFLQKPVQPIVKIGGIDLCT